MRWLLPPTASLDGRAYFAIPPQFHRGGRHGRPGFFFIRTPHILQTIAFAAPTPLPAPESAPDPPRTRLDQLTIVPRHVPVAQFVAGGDTTRTDLADRAGPRRREDLTETHVPSKRSQPTDECRWAAIQRQDHRWLNSVAGPRRDGNSESRTTPELPRWLPGSRVTY